MKNNKSLTSEALLEMASIKDAFSAESKNTIKSLMAEAVKDALRTSICDETDATCDDEDDNHIQEEGKKASKCESKKKNIKEDDDTQEAQPQEDNVDGREESQPAPQQDAEGAEETANYNVTGDNENAQAQPQPDEDDETDFSQYQVDGNPGTYDLTGVNDRAELVKVYRRLSDNDNVVVKKQGNMINLTDNQTGAEYVINTDSEDDATAPETQPVDGEQPQPATETEPDETKSEMNEEFDGEIDFNNASDDDEFEFNFDDKNDEPSIPNNGEDDFLEIVDDNANNEPDFNLDDETNGDEEIAGFKNDVLENKGKNMKGKKEQVFEVDLGYSDEYQELDDVQNDMPQDDEIEFVDDEKETVTPETDNMSEFDEEPVEEAAMSKSRRDRRHMTKTRSTGENEVNPQVTKVHSMNGKVNESLKQLKEENQALKNAVVDLKKELKEAYMTNVNLGKITKLFLENTTTQKEKIDIINRFTNEAKTVKQSTELFESINKQLKAERRANPVLEQKSATPVAKQTINETKIYESDDLKATKDFMKRMMEC